MNIKKELLIGVPVAILLLVTAFFVLNSRSSKDATDIPPTAQNNTITEDQRPTEPPSSPENDVVTYTSEEISEHSLPEDCWIIIESNVYDVTEFAPTHPGTAERIHNFCGANASEAFSTKGGQGTHSEVAKGLLKDLFIGMLNE